jgi:seryl-tRNA synthetase
MLDIRFIREHPDLVKEKSRQKGYDVDVDKLLVLDKERRALLSDIDSEQHSKRDQAETIAKEGGPSVEDHHRKGKEVKEKISKLKERLRPIEEQYNALLKAIPNIPSEDVPIGDSEDDNIPGELKGKKTEFSFEPKTHWQIAESKGWIDKARAAKVTGSRFAYIKGDLVKLQFAIINFTVDKLTSEETLKKIIQDNNLQNVSSNPFIPVLPPLMIRTEVFDAMDRLEPRDERYRVGEDKDNLWLQGSAEHTVGPMHMGEIIDFDKLPLRYLGFATSFRREAGTYGKDTEGIIRMHQFDKLEMESYVNSEGGLGEHLFFVAIQEYLMQELEIPYHVVTKCTADIGKPNARGIDIEAWLPGNKRFLETHTADYMTDYQARRLRIRNKVLDTGGKMYDTKNFPTNFVHMNDATAFALGRTKIAIIENYQTEGGKVSVPVALRPYMGGQLTIG